VGQALRVGAAASHVFINAFPFFGRQVLLPLVCQYGSERRPTCNALYMHLPDYIPLNITCLVSSPRRTFFISLSRRKLKTRIHFASPALPLCRSNEVKAYFASPVSLSLLHNRKTDPSLHRLWQLEKRRTVSRESFRYSVCRNYLYLFAATLTIAFANKTSVSMCFSLRIRFRGRSPANYVPSLGLSNPAPPSEATTQARAVAPPNTFHHLRLDLERQLFNRCVELLQADIIRILTRMDQMHTALWTDVELENVGPDHDVDDYGFEVTPRDSRSTTLDPYDDTSHCCICLVPYTSAHTAFEITACRHTVGKACLSTWLNGTSLNANTCPQCRAELFKRRDLQPVAHSNDAEFAQLDIELLRAMDIFGELERLQDEMFGPEAAAEFFEKLTREINYNFFENDISFMVVSEDGTRPVLGVRRVDWHN
jgi:hypothetical protein